MNLLFWPLSILWDPVSGHDAAEMINYQATKAHVATLKKHDMDELDAKLESDSIDLKRYTLDKRRIDEIQPVKASAAQRDARPFNS